MESDSLCISKALVRDAMGYMFMGYHGVCREAEAGELRFLRLSPETVHWRLSIATRKSKSVSLAARVLIKELLAHGSMRGEGVASD